MRPLIIAHRGASELAPENTLAAFRLARSLGADGIEFDVQVTKDKQLVVAHDYLTDLKSGVRGDIPDMTFDEVRRLDVGSWKAPEFAGEKIPTPAEVLTLCKGMKMIHVELKPYLGRNEDILVDKTLDAIVDAGVEDIAVVTSFHYDLLRKVKERMPQIATCAMSLNMESLFCPTPDEQELMGLKADDPILKKLSGPQAASEAMAMLENSAELEEENSSLLYYLKDRVDSNYSNFPGLNMMQILQQWYHQVDFLDYVSQFDFPVDIVGQEYHAFFRDKDLVSKSHALGYPTAPWPALKDTREQMRALIQMGTDILVTNKPELAISILHGMGQWEEG